MLLLWVFPVGLYTPVQSSVISVLCVGRSEESPRAVITSAWRRLLRVKRNKAKSNIRPPDRSASPVVRPPRLSQYTDIRIAHVERLNASAPVRKTNSISEFITRTAKRSLMPPHCDAVIRPCAWGRCHMPSPSCARAAAAAAGLLMRRQGENRRRSMVYQRGYDPRNAVGRWKFKPTTCRMQFRDACVSVM